MSRDKWRYACPEGHRDILQRGSGVSSIYVGQDKYRCRTCAETYDGKPRDLKAGTV